MSAESKSSPRPENNAKIVKQAPERTVFLPSSDEINEEHCYDKSSCLKLRSEPPDISKNANNETSDDCCEPQQKTDEIEDNVQVKELFDGVVTSLLLVEDAQIKKDSNTNETDATDSDMIVAEEQVITTDIETSSITIGTETNDETDIVSQNNSGVVTNKDNITEVVVESLPQQESIKDAGVKVAVDVLQDGIATPVAPKRPNLRVKSELSLMQPVRQELFNEKLVAKDDLIPSTSLNESKNIEQMPQLFPSALSSTSSPALLGDGIATPRLSICAINRLRVKPEFSMTDEPQNYSEDLSTLPEDFFDDLLVSKPLKEAEEASASNSDAESEDEPIPDDFFDDLLRDEIKERIEEAKNNELEEKYFDRLKELERLENELKAVEEKSNQRHKNKKSKKSKRKSRKRPRPLSPDCKNLQFKNLANSPNYMNHKRHRLSIYNANTKLQSTNNGVNKLDCLRMPATPDLTIKQELQIEESPSQEVEKTVMPQQKNEQACKRVTDLLNHIRNSSTNDMDSKFSTFQFVSTVRKLPARQSCAQSQISENRSPLHSIYNVSYKFNSHATHFNMEEWGLEALPTHAARVAKLLGCDAEFIHNKLKTIKIPPRLKMSVEQKPTDEEEEQFAESSFALYRNVMIQTDDVKEFEVQSKVERYEIGVQAEPDVSSAGSQTLETLSPRKNNDKDDEVPIMQIIRDLNENQLMALHSFAELIKEPLPDANPMEMYKIQMKILEIYKISQIPSALVTPRTSVVNNYRTTNPAQRNPSGNRPAHQQGRSSHLHGRLSQQQGRSTHQQQFQQNSMKQVADGSQFYINDPRTKSAAYVGRIRNGNNADDDALSSPSTNYEPGCSTFTQPLPHQATGFTPNEIYTQTPYNTPIGNVTQHYNAAAPVPQQQPYIRNQTTSTKFYGRGGLRR